MKPWYSGRLFVFSIVGLFVFLLVQDTPAQAQYLFLDAPRLLNRVDSSASASLTSAPAKSLRAPIFLSESVSAYRQTLRSSDTIPLSNMTLGKYDTRAAAAARMISGETGERFVERYFAEQGWKTVPRVGGPQGIDGLFYRIEPNGRLRVMIVESKTGQSGLGLTKHKGWQMSHEWIAKSVDQQIESYRKAIGRCTDPVERVKLQRNLDTLRKVQAQIAIGDYRSRMVRMKVDGGYLHIDFFKVSDQGTNSPTMVKSSRSRHIDLANPDQLGRNNRKVYEQFFADKKESLLKKVGDRKFAEETIEELKKAYKTQVVQNSSDEYRFIARKLTNHYSKVAADRYAKLMRKLPASWRAGAIKFLMPLIKMEAITRTELVTAKIAKSGGKALIVADVALNAYMTYGDFRRWQNSEITGGYLAFKSALRTGQMALTYYTVFSPEPGPFTRVAAGIGAVFLVAVDIASDPILDRAQARMKRVYLHVDQTERFASCRMKLLANIP